jgi:hypothetical protein
MRKIHTKGPKVARDHAILAKLYDSFCRAFPWYTPLPIDELSKLNNFKLNALCVEVWEAQTVEDQTTYLALCKSNPKLVTTIPRPLKYRPLIIAEELQEVKT